MMKLKQIRMNTATVMIVMMVLSTIMVLSTLANNNVFAKEIKIHNNLEQSLIFNEIENRQDVEIYDPPPDKIKAGGTGLAEVYHGNEGDFKTVHFKVQYYVGEKGSAETVTFGFKSKSDGTEWNNFNCFTDTPDDIKGSHGGCNSGTTHYTFDPK